MDGDQSNSGTGLLGHYGVLVVPAPPDIDGAWFITLARWDGGHEGYVSGTDGPMFDNQADAIREANRLTEWLAEHQDEDRLAHAWDVISQQVARDSTPLTDVVSRLGAFY